MTATRSDLDASDVRSLVPLFALHDRLRAAVLDEGVVLVLPWAMLPGIVGVAGLEVVHADVSRPMLGLARDEGGTA